jgi:hypothetical protein
VQNHVAAVAVLAITLIVPMVAWLLGFADSF